MGIRWRNSAWVWSSREQECQFAGWRRGGESGFAEWPVDGGDEFGGVRGGGCSDIVD